MDILNSPGISIAIMGVYMAVVIYIGIFAWRNFPQTDTESYLLGGRSLSGWVTSLTLQATQISALTFLGFVGFMYLFGVAFWEAIMGYLFLVPLVWLLFNTRVWKLGRRFGHITFGDAVSHYCNNNKWVSAVVGAAMIIAIVPYVQTQFAGLGYVVSQASGGVISFQLAIIISYAVMLLYVFMGGMRAVAYIDAFQGALLLGGFIGGGLLMALLAANGSFANAFDQILAQPQGAQKVGVLGLGPFGQWLFLVTWAVAVNLGWPLHPHMWNKQHLPRSIEFTRYMPAVHMLQVWLIFLGAYFFSIAGLIRLPGLNPLQANTVTIDVAKNMFPLVVVGLFAAAGLAAMMSTVAGQIHSVGTIVTRDFVAKFKPNMTETQGVLYSRLACVIHGLISITLVLTGDTILAAVGALAAGLGVQILPSVAAMMFNQKWLTTQGVIASVVVGIGLTVALGLGWLNSVFGGPNPFGIFYAFIALVVNAVVLLVVSAATRSHPSEEIRTSFAQVGW